MVNTAEMRTGLGDVSPRHPGVAPTVLSMLQSARRGLAEAADESAPGARYVTAHLAQEAAQRVGTAAPGRAGADGMGRVLRGRGRQARGRRSGADACRVGTRGR